MNKTINQKAWFFVIPVFVLVAFNAAIPLMTVVNYSFQETFGNNVFAWEGTRWFKQILLSERFHAALGRQIAFTFIILLIQSAFQILPFYFEWIAMTGVIIFTFLSLFSYFKSEGKLIFEQFL